MRHRRTYDEIRDDIQEGKYVTSEEYEFVYERDRAHVCPDCGTEQVVGLGRDVWDAHKLYCPAWQQYCTLCHASYPDTPESIEAHLAACPARKEK